MVKESDYILHLMIDSLKKSFKILNISIKKTIMKIEYKPLKKVLINFTTLNILILKLVLLFTIFMD